MKNKKRLVGKLIVIMVAVGALAGGIIAPTPAQADARGQQWTGLGILTIHAHGDGLYVPNVAVGLSNLPHGVDAMR